MTDTASSGPYALAAQDYRRAGWHGVLPIGPRAGMKYPPPHGWTGHGAPMPSASDVAAWQETHGDRNVGLRLPPGVIGLDVDHYSKDGKGKLGGDTLCELEARLGPLPPTWITSARTDGVSGIRLYRVPTHLDDGTEINWPGEAGPNIEIIQTGHRYALVWPSINPEADGAVYRWLQQSDGIAVDVVPFIDQLPDLPAAWVDGLRLQYGRTEKADLAEPAMARWWEQLRPGPMCLTINRAYAQGVDNIKADAGSRHETARDVARLLAAYGGEGHSGAQLGLGQLAHAFAEAVGPERIAGGEWQRLLAGAVKLAAAKNPTPLQLDPCQPPDVTFGGTLAPPPFSGPGAGPNCDEVPAPGGLTLPDDFWRARPSLSLIRQAAHSRVRSADVVFYGVLVRLAAMAPHLLRLDTGVGEPASANLFAAIIGPSGSGKSSGLSVARQVLPAADLEQVPLGSGEGLAEAYMGMVSVDDPAGALTKDGSAVRKVRQKAQVRHNVLAAADEGASLNKLLERTGSTVGEALRSAWNGETIGQKNGREETTRVVHGGSYALGLLIGYQPTTALPLLADVDAGTPQRFLYGWAIDPSIPTRGERVEWPGAAINPFPPEAELEGDEQPKLFSRPAGRDVTAVTYAQVIRDELYDEQYAKATGAVTTDPYRSQHTLLKVKTSALLALLDTDPVTGRGRRHVTPDDWDLAQVVLDTSDRVRAHLQQQAAIASREAWERETTALSSRALHTHATIEAHAQAAASDAAVRVAGSLTAKVHALGGMSRSDARKAVSSSRRHLFDDAVEVAVAEHWIVDTGRRLEPGSSLPAGVAGA
jgi:bifunctional DNA primase/polymerase-like protein